MEDVSQGRAQPQGTWRQEARSTQTTLSSAALALTDLLGFSEREHRWSIYSLLLPHHLHSFIHSPNHLSLLIMCSRGLPSSVGETEPQPRKNLSQGQALLEGIQGLWETQGGGRAIRWETARGLGDVLHTGFLN